MSKKYITLALTIINPLFFYWIMFGLVPLRYELAGGELGPEGLAYLLAFVTGIPYGIVCIIAIYKLAAELFPKIKEINKIYKLLALAIILIPLLPFAIVASSIGIFLVAIIGLSFLIIKVTNSKIEHIEKPLFNIAVTQFSLALVLTVIVSIIPPEASLIGLSFGLPIVFLIAITAYVITFIASR
jgi:hypothetical protein